MVFFLLFAVVVVSGRNCDSGLVNTGGIITIGDYQTSFSLAAGASVCLHTFFTAPALSTPSTSNFAWSIQPSSPIASNSRLFVGEVPAGNQNGNCNNFVERGNIIVGSPAPYALGKYGPITISPGNKPSIKIQCTNTVFSCTFPSSWLETCWIQAEPTTTGSSASATASPTTSSTRLYAGWYRVTTNSGCTVAQCGACFDPSVTQLDMTLVGDAIDSQTSDLLVIMPNNTARWDGLAYSVSRNDQTFTLDRVNAVCRIVLTCDSGECARWTISTATSRTISTTRSTITSRPASGNVVTPFCILFVAIGIALFF